MRDYYKNNKTLGPSERAIISQFVYDLVRYNTILTYIAKSDDWNHKLDKLNEIQNQIENPNLPLYIFLFYRKIIKK